METKRKKQLIEERKRFYQKANRICAHHKNLDVETIVLTFYNLKYKPYQRLKRALLRAGKINSY